MKILSIKLSGIGSYGSDSRGGSLSLNEPDHSALIVGPNGIGKTWFVEGIALALYGKTIRSLRSIDEIVNWDDEAGSVIVEFECRGRKLEAIFERSRKRQKTYRRVFEKGRCLTNGMSVAQIQEELDQIIGLEWNVFRQSSLFGQKDVSEFLNGTDRQRRELIGSVLDLERFALAAERASNARRRHERGLIEVEAELAQDAPEPPNRKSLEHNQKVLERWIEGEESQIEEIRERLTEFNPRTRIRRRSQIEQEISDVKSLLGNTKRALQDLERENLKFWNAAGPALYRVAKGTRDPEHWQEAKRRVFEESLEWRSATSLTKQEEKQTEQLFELEKKFQKIHNESANEDLERRKLERHLKHHQENARSHRQQHTEGVRELAQIELLEEQYQAAQKQAVVFRKLREHILEQIEIYRFWEHGFRYGIPDMILTQSLLPLEDRTNHFLSELGGDYSIQFALDRQTKTGRTKEDLRIVLLKNQREIELGSLSGGEQQRVELAVRFGLASMSPTSGCLILDEVTSGIDESGLRSLLSLLANQKQQGTQILCITHEPRLSAAFDNVIDLEQ